MSADPSFDVFGLDHGVRLVSGLGLDVDDAERADQILRVEFGHGGAVLGKVQRRIDMGAGMLEDVEFPDLVAGGIEIDILGKKNSGLAIKSREITIQSMGEIDHLARCLRKGRAGGNSACCSGGKSGGSRFAEEITTRQH